MIRAGDVGEHLMNKILDCMEHADKCHELAVTASNQIDKQQCLELEEMWRASARTQLQSWIKENPPIVH